MVALHTGTLPEDTVHALSARGIPLQRVPHLEPPPLSSAFHGGNGNGTAGTWYPHDSRFRECFTKLAVFSLTGYARITLLDADMLVLRNMDDLFDIPLDTTDRLFAATHACVCNPLRLAHYPPDWIPANCAFTQQQQQQQQQDRDQDRDRDKDKTQTQPQTTTEAPPSKGSLGILNGGLVSLTPSGALTAQIGEYLTSAATATPANLPFADQSLLSNLFRGRWVPLPYFYNALQTMRWRGVHDALWRDGEVRCVHYILGQGRKPWESKPENTEEGGRRRRRRLESGDSMVNGGAMKKGVAEREEGGGGGGRQRGQTKEQESKQNGNKEEQEIGDDGTMRRWWREIDGERRLWEAENEIA